VPAAISFGQQCQRSIARTTGSGASDFGSRPSGGLGDYQARADTKARLEQLDEMISSDSRTRNAGSGPGLRSVVLWWNGVRPHRELINRGVSVLGARGSRLAFGRRVRADTRPQRRLLPGI
jgi:hypothetical protein